MLRSHGLRAAVSADDAGGQYPQLQIQGVRVLVAPSDEASSRRLLASSSAHGDWSACGGVEARVVTGMWQGSPMRPRSRLRSQFGAPSVDKALGALPVIADLCRRLDLAGIIDRACPVREVALVTHGQVIEALVANRLTSPTPLVHVEQWASQWAVQEVWGIDPHVLNDDRIGRALDAVAPQLDQIVGSVGARAIGVFGLEVARLHWDLTSISLYGAYPDPDDGFPTPRYGHPKDRRPDLKQVQTGLAVTGDQDGGVPIFHRAQKARRTQAAAAGRRLQAGLLPQPAGHDRRQGRLHRAGLQDLRARPNLRRAGPPGRHPGRLCRRP